MAVATTEVVSNVPGVLPGGALRRAQQIHALAIVLLPLVGSALAVERAVGASIEWWQLALCAVMYATTMLGITVGFHRLLAHRAFDASPFVRVLLLAAGSAAAQGPPIYWVANHRRHHRFADLTGDPHSPNLHGVGFRHSAIGLWHAHVGWMFTHELTNPLVYAKDLMRDPLIAKTSRLYWIWIGVGLALPAAIGALITRSVDGAVSGALWGGAVRLFLSYHFTSCINSVTHALGRRRFDTPDGSRNVAWLALPTLGESWHNNHHAYPSSAVFGLRWWQLDPGAWLIRALCASGLASNAHIARERRPHR